MTQPLIQRNIVVIGGTGVGKSSFLNNLALVFRFATFEDAENGANSFVPPIPVRMTFNNVRIVDGENGTETSDRERFEFPKPEILQTTFGNVVFNFIDTPGMILPSGFKADDEHMRQIITCFAQFEEIHGILALLKSSDNTLNYDIKYTLNTLLSCFGKTARKMISFGITHAGFNKDPGRVFDVIQKYFQDSRNNPGIDYSIGNLYCFESIPLFHVLSTKMGATATKRDQTIFRWAFESNVEELHRYLSLLYHRNDSYHMINIPTLAIAKCIQPALTSLLPYLDSKDEQIMIDLNHLENQHQAHRQNEYALKQMRDWYEDYRVLNFRAIRMSIVEGYETSLTAVINILPTRIAELFGVMDEAHEENQDTENQEETNAVVKAILEMIDTERANLRTNQLENSSLYHKFQAEKKMASSLLCDIASYLEEHAIDGLDHGIGLRENSEVANYMDKLKISGHWTPTLKTIGAPEIIAKLAAMQDSQHFGNVIRKIFSEKCRNLEHVQYRMTSIPVEPDNAFFNRLDRSIQ